LNGAVGTKGKLMPTFPLIVFLPTFVHTIPPGYRTTTCRLTCVSSNLQERTNQQGGQPAPAEKHRMLTTEPTPIRAKTAPMTAVPTLTTYRLFPAAATTFLCEHPITPLLHHSLIPFFFVCLEFTITAYCAIIKRRRRQ
jgi:hypothetical protein